MGEPEQSARKRLQHVALATPDIGDRAIDLADSELNVRSMTGGAWQNTNPPAGMRKGEVP